MKSIISKLPRCKHTRHSLEANFQFRGKPQGIKPFGGANKILTLLVLPLLLSYTWSTMAQETTSFRLLDQESALPIKDASYTYGSQSGTSDASGTITLTYESETVLSLSHLNYGTWSYQNAEVLALLKEKVVYQQKVTVNLYPVTVIALRPVNRPTEKVTLGYQEQLAHDAASILNQNPGFTSIQKSGNYGFDPVFRGFKYDQLNIVLNGAQSATAACPNRMDPPTSQMAPNMMDRIEVLKGPHALRYGSGFGATINFVPTKLRFTENDELYGRVSSGYDGNGSILRNEAQIGFSGKNHDVALFGSWSTGNDYTTGNGETTQADFNRGSFGANIGFKVNDAHQLRFSATYNVARDADFPALGMDLREDDTWMLNLRHDVNFDDGPLSSWNTTAFASFVDHLMDNLLKPLDPRTVNTSTTATTFNFGGRTEGIWNFNKANLFAGIDFRREGAEGIRTRDFIAGPNAGNTVQDNAWQDGAISKTGLFAEYQLPWEKTQLVISTRLELNSGDINDPTDDFTALYDETQVTQFNPSFSLGVTRKMSNEIRLGLWAGRTQRSGGLTERYIHFFPVGQDPFELLGNPELNPEVNNQVDLNFNWQNENTNITIDLFAGYLQDFISSVIDESLNPVLPSSPGVRQYINIEDAFKTGFEFNWNQELLLGLQHQLGVAYTYAQDLERDEPLPEIAPLDVRYTLLGSFMKGKLRPEASFRHVLEQARISEEFGETVTPSFTLLDIKLDYQITDAARVTLGVNNIFDENYYEHLTRSVQGTNDPIFAPGRNAFASINFVF